MAQLDFREAMLFNFERLEQHHYQSNKKGTLLGCRGKMKVSNEVSLAKARLRYQSNEMMPYPILYFLKNACIDFFEILSSLKQLYQVRDPDIVSSKLSLMVSFRPFVKWDLALFHCYGNWEPDGIYFI